MDTMQKRVLTQEPQVQEEVASARLVTEERLKALGLTKASKDFEKARKMGIAYNKYLFVSAEIIAQFNEKLRKETLQENARAYTYKTLAFIPLAQYTAIPPENVLAALEEAKNVGCFDAFEVAKIEWREEIKDPILFGTIEGCTDKFFISQWDDDVKVEDLLFMER